MEAILESNSQHQSAEAKVTNSSTTTRKALLTNEEEVLKICLEVVKELLETHPSAAHTQACPVARST